MNIKNTTKSSNGFTLPEVLVAIGISSFALLVIMTFGISAYNTFQETTATIDTSESLSRAAYSLTQALTYATNIENVPGTTISSSISRIQKGQILGAYTTTLNGGLRPIANFIRDSGTEITNTSEGPRSSLRGTSIFFFNPAERTSGVLFINMGSPNKLISQMTPSYSDNYFDRLVDLTIDSPQQTAGVLTGIRIQLTARTFFKADKSLWRWCPSSNASAGCQGASYKDLSRVIYVSFLNQVITPRSLWKSNSAPTRLFDTLYFFPSRFPYE